MVIKSTANCLIRREKKKAFIENLYSVYLCVFNFTEYYTVYF